MQVVEEHAMGRDLGGWRDLGRSTSQCTAIHGADLEAGVII